MPPYLRCYQVARAFRPQVRCDSTSVAPDGDLRDRSTMMNNRVRELKDTKKLRYPRIRHSARPIPIPQFRKLYEKVAKGSPSSEVVAVNGRIQSVRRVGAKLAFFHITNEFDNLQVLCNFQKLKGEGTSEAEFKDLLRILRRGDIVEVYGRPIRTEAGELSIEALMVPQLLSPSLVPLPTSLVDDDTRIQNRHIDLLVNPQTTNTLRIRAHVIKYMRGFFEDRGFLEFQTPILAGNAGGAFARPFVTAATEFPARELALRIAPELWLKRLIVGGIDKVYELGPAFRNEGIDGLHNPEFTSCEFYQAYANLEDLLAMTEALLLGLADHMVRLRTDSDSLSATPIPENSWQAGFQRIEFIPTLEEKLGFRLPDLEGKDAFAELSSLLATHNVALGDGPMPATLNKLLDRLASRFLETGDAELHGQPIFVTHHPACMSPLAKSFVCPRTQQLVAARAELFVEGVELANMYEEENDPFLQREKMVAQVRAGRERAAAAAGGLEPSVGDEDAEAAVVDESYIQVLESGLPPTGGWGCGVERLVMLFSGARGSVIA